MAARLDKQRPLSSAVDVSRARTAGWLMICDDGKDSRKIIPWARACQWVAPDVAGMCIDMISTSIHSTCALCKW